MRSPIFIFSALLCLPLAATAQSEPPLQLKRVTLSSSGVGYFEFEAQVERDAVLKLPVKLEQVDDVLKSLVVYDSKGQIAGVSLPGREPLSELLRALPFDASALSSMPALLSALPGAQIKVKTGANSFSGRLTGVQSSTERSDKGADITRHRASVMTAQGLRLFVVEDAQVEFEDKALREHIEQALAAINANRAKDGRTVEIATRGSERRTVRLGYVTSTPIWKTAYRLTVPGQGASATATQLQGWAVIENLSGQDWRGVELTLTSGRPVAFRQSLYESYFNPRPSVPIEMPGRIVPRADLGTMQVQEFVVAPSLELRLSPPMPTAAPALAAPRPVMSRAAPAPAPAPAAAPMPPPPPSAPMLAQVADLAAAQDQGTQMSYRFPLPVHVGNGRSLAVPIIVQEFASSRVAQYQPQVSSQYPLAALELSNASANGLPAGAVTVYEQGSAGAAFLGDAQLAVLPAGDKRLLSYAVDQKISITTSTRNSNTTTRVFTERGVLVTEGVQLITSIFNIKSAHTQDTAVVVEVPKYSGYTLKTPSGKELGEAQGRQRVSLPAPAGKALSHEITQELATPNRQSLANLSVLALKDNMRLAKDPASLGVLQRLLAIREAQELADEQHRAASTEIAEQQTEQARLRENLGVASKGSDLAKLYSANLLQAEARILAAYKLRDDATARQQKLLADVRSFFASL